MKKIFLLPACLVCFAMASIAQSKELPPPPPPPKPPVVKEIEFTPPVIVKDQKANTATAVKTTKAKKEPVKFTAPVIVKDIAVNPAPPTIIPKRTKTTPAKFTPPVIVKDKEVKSSKPVIRADKNEQ